MITSGECFHDWEISDFLNSKYRCKKCGVSGEACDYCDGTGEDPLNDDEEFEVCPECDGQEVFEEGEQ